MCLRPNILRYSRVPTTQSNSRLIPDHARTNNPSPLNTRPGHMDEGSGFIFSLDLNGCSVSWVIWGVGGGLGLELLCGLFLHPCHFRSSSSFPFRSIARFSLLLSLCVVFFCAAFLSFHCLRSHYTKSVLSNLVTIGLFRVVWYGDCETSKITRKRGEVNNIHRKTHRYINIWTLGSQEHG